jgi:hypothetical protein
LAFEREDSHLVLATVRKPATGWDQSTASALNHLVRQLAAVHSWRRLAVSMHPSAWSQLAMHLNYNLSFPKPGVPMIGSASDDPRRVAVVLRDAP